MCATSLHVDLVTGAKQSPAQRFWKPSPDTMRGISAFAIATQADAAAALMRHSWEAGQSWRGIFASREEDI